jgi:CBS domain-containing protein
MTIGKICKRDVDLANADETVRAAAKRMKERHVGTLVVVNDEKVPVGLITDRDLAIRVLGDDRDPGGTTVGDVMTHHPRTISERSPIEEGLDLMRTLGVRRLPVVGWKDQLVGIVSMDDLLSLFIRELCDMGGVLGTQAPHSGPPLPTSW